MSKIRKTALCSILAAMGVMFLYIGSVITVLDLTMTAIASLIVVFCVIELNGYYPWLTYGVTAILAILLLPNKLTGVIYLCFGGLYPILKANFERYHYVVSWILKLSVFNTGLLIAILISQFLLHLGDEGLELTLPVLAVGNLVFVLYDVAMTRLITLYLIKFRKMLGLKNYFEN
ncbi:MAG: hypothetical protein IJA85_01655 [Clostridia bacterium]|nr:hypothetical protein [Clostridia bacterium]MBQ4573880.1 hypothetical protein [Clostridia bacterium]